MKLKDFAIINMGQSPKGETYNSEQKGTPFLQGRKTFGRLYPTIDTWTTSPIKIANKGEILMSVRAPVGDMNISTQDICIGRGLCSISAKNGRNKYLYYVLLNNMEKIKQNSTGTVFSSINKNDLENLEIDFHSDKTQKKIEKILDDIDSKIELNTEINNNLFELLINDFNEFLDKNSDSEIVKLEDCVEKINTGADAIQRAPIVNYDTGVRCIRIGDMTNGRDYHSWGFTKMTDKDFENYKLIRNDIVITRTAVNGLTYMITNEENTVCNNGNIRLRVNNKYNPLYIYLNTKTKDFRNYIDRISSETSVRPNMKVEYFTSYKIKKIDLNVQNEFCNRSESIMKNIQNNKVENYNLEQLRDTLLPKLIKGEINLDNIEI